MVKNAILDENINLNFFRHKLILVHLSFANRCFCNATKTTDNRHAYAINEYYKIEGLIYQPKLSVLEQLQRAIYFMPLIQCRVRYEHVCQDFLHKSHFICC